MFNRKKKKNEILADQKAPANNALKESANDIDTEASASEADDVQRKNENTAEELPEIKISLAEKLGGTFEDFNSLDPMPDKAEQTEISTSAEPVTAYPAISGTTLQQPKEPTFSLEQLADQVQQYAKQLAEEEANVSLYYNKIAENRTKITQIEEQASNLEQQIISKQVTLRAIQNDIGNIETLISDKQAQLQSVKEELAANENLLEQKTASLNNACNAWQEKYNLLQQYKKNEESQHQTTENAQQEKAANSVSTMPQADVSQNDALSIAAESGAPVISDVPIPDFSELEEELNKAANIKPAKRKKRTLWAYLLCIILAALLAFGLRTYVIQLTLISGESMEYTIQSGDRVLTNRLAYYDHMPQKGDIIVFQAPDTAQQTYYVKRVIATAGDNLVITDGKVFINGIEQQEDYVYDLTMGEINTVVPDGEIFVMGDNRKVSHDSRSDSVSFITKDQIIGKVVYRIMPFDKIGAIK